MVYLEKAWGESIDDATMEDIMVAIDETQKMDEEHGAFWVLSDESENTLEVSKDLVLTAAFDDNQEKQYKIKSKDWEEVKTLYELYLTEQFDLLKKAFA